MCLFLFSSNYVQFKKEGKSSYFLKIGIQKLKTARSVQLEAVYLEALL